MFKSYIRVLCEAFNAELNDNFASYGKKYVVGHLPCQPNYVNFSVNWVVLGHIN